MRYSNFRRACVSLLAAAAILLPSWAGADQQIEFQDYEDILKVMDDLGFTQEAWQSENYAVPRLYLTSVPHRWRESVSDEIEVKLKKRIFFRLLGPLVLRSNEIILEDRQHLLSLQEADSLTEDDRAWLAGLAVRYGVVEDADEELPPEAISELVLRVDAVPPSLTLAQAAEESGWGTSRFADEGNAIFGQWTWGDEGIVPEEQREGMGDYKIASFETPLESVQGYMLNINSHDAYGELRTLRAAVRSEGREPTGRELAQALTSYSERGPEYVDGLLAIMDVNKLDATDEAWLVDGETTYLTPVGTGSE
jgi:uncharacterized FlgJ-related protein